MIALTVSLKVMVRDTQVYAPLAVHDAVVTFLSRHQFHLDGNGSLISATSGDCRLLIRGMDSRGYNLDAINVMHAQKGRLSFVFKGKVYLERPINITETTLSHYWTRLKQKLGIVAVSHPVLAVSASGSCALEALPWNEIAEL